MPDGQVIFEIEGDNKPLKQSLNETTNAIEKESVKWDKAAGNAATGMETKMTSMFTKIGAAAIAAKVGQTLLEWGKDAIAAASDLEEVQNVVDVTFGESASQIDAWAKTAINQFGLTETKAKQFASTLGAMMKSAGMAGPEIVEMSENLAGLAADMASFYNMDFETAFQKIRSGIAGETEPLRQLGINMSVASLNAFALEKGLGKTFEQMSQGEQVTLRYQYLMQATADAQGDFARTSDGYANGLRLLESNIDSIKTRLGQILVPALAEATKGLNDFLGSLTQERPQTVLDQFNQIDIDTAGKLEKIKATADEAQNLISVLGELDNTDASGALRNIASGANVLKADAPGTWQSLLSAVSNTTGIRTFGNNASGAAVGIEDLASALAGASESMSQAEAWDTLLSTLSANAGELTALTGKDEGATREWLQGLADSANALESGKAGDWNTLLSSLVSGLPGLGNTEAGKAFFDSMAQNFLAMGSESEQAKSGLTALGWSTDQINERQTQWLETCKRLVQTIPGLSEIINTQTGEVKGGAQAVQDYVREWQQGQEKLLAQQALYAKKQAIINKQAEMENLRLDMLVAQQRVKNRWDEWLAQGGNMNPRNPLTGEMEELQKAASEAKKIYEEQKSALDQAVEAYEIAENIVGEMPGTLEEVAQAGEDAANGIKTFEDATAKAAQESIKNFETALKSLTDYTEKAYESNRQAISNTLNGFSALVTPAEAAKRKMEELKLAGEEVTDSVARGFDEAVPSIENMTAGLASQLEHLRQYNDNLAKMKAAGFSADVLAMVSDGSAQSMDYAAELARNGSNTAKVSEVNRLVADVKSASDELASTMTENNLAVDANMQELLANYTAALEGLNQYDGAKENAAQTVQGIVDGLAENASAVQAQVENIMSMLAELSGASYNVTIPGVNLNSTIGSNSTTQVHTTINLDGTKLGEAVSQHQANTLTTLDRSGWGGDR